MVKCRLARAIRAVTAVIVGIAGCGRTELPSAAPEEWTPERLGQVLREAGYDTDLADIVVKASRADRPAIFLVIRRDIGAIAIDHYWHVRPEDRDDALLLWTLNRANSMSRLNRYYLAEGGNVVVSTFIPLESGLSPRAVTSFVARALGEFDVVVDESGLYRFVRRPE